MTKTKFSAFIICFIVITVFVNVEYVFPQNVAALPNNKLLQPYQEKFEPSTELIVSARDAGCLGNNPKFDEPDCKITPNEEWDKLDDLTLYNENGTVWYNFSINDYSPKFLLKNKKEDFLPLATSLKSTSLYLRMKAESPNWFEVEINEETQATKYVLKSDRMWAKTTWKHLLGRIGAVKFFDDQQPVLLDSPDGKVLKESSEIRLRSAVLENIEGDWIFVEYRDSANSYKGWVRWRQGRKLLFEPDKFWIKFPVLSLK